VLVFDTLINGDMAKKMNSRHVRKMRVFCSDNAMSKRFFFLIFSENFLTCEKSHVKNISDVGNSAMSEKFFFFFFKNVFDA
jgi:hypothetical protein